MDTQSISFGQFWWRVTASHIITYFVAGVLAANLLHYEEVFNGSDTLRAFDSPFIAAGPGLQVIRGFIFATALWFFKEGFIKVKFGWLKLWWLVMALSILSTTAAAPGSIEGFIYTRTPILDQMKGYLEVMPQTLAFALLVFFWYQHPKKLWNVISVVVVVLIVLMSILGVLAGLGVIQVPS